MRNFVKECREALGYSQSELSARGNLSSKTIGNMERVPAFDFHQPSKRKLTAALGLDSWAIKFIFPTDDSPEDQPWSHYVSAQSEYCERNEKQMLMDRVAVCDACKHAYFDHPSLTMIDALTRRIFECPRSDCGQPFFNDDE